MMIRVDKNGHSEMEQTYTKRATHLLGDAMGKTKKLTKKQCTARFQIPCKKALPYKKSESNSGKLTY